MMEPLLITVPGEMRGKGRPKFARRGQFVTAYTPERTVSAENWVKACAVDQVGSPCLTGPLCVWITIGVPIRPSWPKKRQSESLSGAIKPTSKPDGDNTQKLIFDALNKIVWDDDAQIVDIVFSKRYAAEPYTTIRVESA